MIIVGLEGKIGVFIDHRKLIQLKVCSNKKGVNSLAFCSKKNCIYAACLDSTVKIIELSELKRIIVE